MSNAQKKLDDLWMRLRQESSQQNVMNSHGPGGPGNGPPPSRPSLPRLGNITNSPVSVRPNNLPFGARMNDNEETERSLREIMKISGDLRIDGKLYKTDIKDMEELEVLGNGTCGHVYKMRHKPSKQIIAVKQMRRSGNRDENKRIIMDIEVVLKSNCKYIVHCLGCFIMESDVWICMELMDTCFDKLLKKLKQPIPENVLGKITLATVEALSYLKDKHDVIHRDVKPSNILLDKKGNVKLCDFGISGRLVDSMARTRSAGCAAYMAPERIELDPENPDYDVRADVWSLGITLVELATGRCPYQDCKTDFEVLTKVIGEEPPSLPKDSEFSDEFRDFVRLCLIKDKKERPKYKQLKNHAFIKQYERADVNVGDWFSKAIQQVEGAPRQNFSTSSIRQFFASKQPPLTNGSSTKPQESGRSRIATFQREAQPFSQSTKTYSPLQAYKNHLAKQQESYIPLPQRLGSETKFGSPVMPRRLEDGYRKVGDRWRSPSASPLPLRNQVEEQQYNCGNTSPIILQRFYHQQKQQQMAKEAEESGKKRFASYIKMQLTGDRSGRSSRHQSPEPPPRLNRGVSGDQSPLALRRNLLESHSSNSPSLSRRYVSPSPPVPPPRRLSESNSVPGSPQHLRARFHYTPEPQRRLYQNNDVS